MSPPPPPGLAQSTCLAQSSRLLTELRDVVKPSTPIGDPEVRFPGLRGPNLVRLHPGYTHEQCQCIRQTPQVLMADENCISSNDAHHYHPLVMSHYDAALMTPPVAARENQRNPLCSRLRVEIASSRFQGSSLNKHFCFVHPHFGANKTYQNCPRYPNFLVHSGPAQSCCSWPSLAGEAQTFLPPPLFAPWPIQPCNNCFTVEKQ